MSEPIKIEKGVPIAARKSRHRKYPFRELETGDSFFVAQKTTNSLSGLLNRYGKTMKKKFAARTVEGGMRVWRVK